MAWTPVTLTPNAQTVLAHRYLHKDEHGQVIETPEAMWAASHTSLPWWISAMIRTSTW